MKKILLFVIVALCSSIIARADWIISPVPLVEANRPYKYINAQYFTYKTDKYTFQYRTDDPDQFTIYTEQVLELIDNYTGYMSNYNYNRVRVVLCNEQGYSVKRFEMFLCDKQRNRRMLATLPPPIPGQKSAVKRILKHLQSGTGYVRILVKTFSEGTLDIQLPVIPADLQPYLNSKNKKR